MWNFKLAGALYVYEALLMVGWVWDVQPPYIAIDGERDIYRALDYHHVQEAYLHHLQIQEGKSFRWVRLQETWVDYPTTIHDNHCLCWHYIGIWVSISGLWSLFWLLSYIFYRIWVLGSSFIMIHILSTTCSSVTWCYFSIITEEMFLDINFVFYEH